MKRVSIIIPVYNTEQYLVECLESAINQTEDNIEIICIDDDSRDNSLKILNKYAEVDDRITVIHNEVNEGSLMTRNHGIEIANSEYILFLDSDDYIKPNTCKELYNIAQNSKADIVNYGVEIKNCDNLPSGRVKGTERYMTPYVGSLVGKEILTKCFIYRAFNSNLSSKFIRTSICKKSIGYTLLQHACMAEDLYAFFVMAFFSNVMVGTEKKYYTYCYGRGLTGRLQIDLNTFKNYCSQADVSTAIANFLKLQNCYEDYVEIHKSIEQRLLDHCIGSWRRLSSEERDKGILELQNHWGYESIIKYVFFRDLITPSAYIPPHSISDNPIMHDSKEEVLIQYRKGEIGFRYIIKYLGAWFYYKTHKNK